MGRLVRWPHLAWLCELAGSRTNLQVWLFGSALWSDKPRDIDVLLVYTDYEDVARVKRANWWADEDPPIDLIAMTPGEERDYDFISSTTAERLV